MENIGKITIDSVLDLVAIAEVAGQPDPDARWYDSGVLYVRNVTDEALAAAAEKVNAPEVQAAREKQARLDEITARLAEIDILTMRPVRAILLGTGTDDDQLKLAELEAEAEPLRNELRQLKGETE